MSLTVGGIVSGLGNFVGISQAGFTPKYYCDDRIEILRSRTFAQHFPEVQRDSSIESFSDEKVDLIMSSPPCAQVSSLGMKREDRKDIAFMPFEDFDFVRVLDEVLSRNANFYIIEYLPSILRYIEIHTSGLVHKDSSVLYPWDENYRVQLITLNTLQYGIPQHRKRIFLLMSKKKYDFIYLTPTDKVLNDTNVGPLLELIQSYRDKGESLMNDEPPNHTPARIKGFSELKIGESYYGGQNNRKIDPNKPGPTITSHRTRYVHPWQPRVLNVRECAAIQGFPLDFGFYDSESINLDLIGKTISPPIIKHIGEQIKKNIEKHQYLGTYE